MVNSQSQLFRLGAYGVVIDQGKLLLTTKVLGPYKGLLCLPGGGIEFGETPEEALEREFREEVALAFTHATLLNNLSVTSTFTEANEVFTFHHIGLVYTVIGTTPIPDLTAEDPHDWYDLNLLKPAQLAPFAQMLVQRAWPS